MIRSLRHPALVAIAPAVAVGLLVVAAPAGVRELAVGWGLALVGAWTAWLAHRRWLVSGADGWRRVTRTALLWTASQALFASVGRGSGPLLTLSSFGFLLVAVSAADVVLRSPHASRASALVAALDAAAVGLALGGLLWEPVLAPAVATTSFVDGVPFTILGVAVVALGLSIIGQSGGGDRALVAIVVGSSTLLAGDIRYLHDVGHGGYEPGGLTDVLWVAGVAGIGLVAAVAGPHRRSACRWWHQAWVAFPLGLLVLEAVRQQTEGVVAPSLVVCGGLSFLFYAVRQVVLHRDLVVLTNATAQDRNRLAEAEERSRLLLEHSGDGILGADLSGTIIFANRAAEAMLGLAPGEANGRPGHDVTHRSRPDGSPYPREECTLGPAVARGEAVSADLDWWSCTDGTFLPVAYRAAPVVQDGLPWGSVISFRDVSARLASTEALEAQERRWRSLVLHSSDVVVVLDRSYRVVFTTPSVDRVLGYDAGQRAGQDLARFVHPDDLEAIAEDLGWLQSQPGGTMRTSTRRYRHAGGRWLWMEATATNLLDDPDVAGIVCNLRDVTDRVEAEDELRHQATHDALTRLPNRAGLRRWAIEHAASDEPLGLILLDLDGFKEVNDALGHPAGDELLCRVADRLRYSIGPADVAGRLGGDEFALLVAGIDRPGLEALAARVLATIDEPVDVAGWTLTVSASAGCTLDPTWDLDRALQEADIALYRAKRVPGGGTSATYGREDAQDRLLDLELTAELRQAIVGGDMATWYQLKVDATTGEPVGAEALSRWCHSSHGTISPATFIPLAERAGLVGGLTDLVLDRAIEQAARWFADGIEVPVAVNVSPLSLRDRGFADRVLQRLDRVGLAPRLLEVEITEEAVADPNDTVIGNLDRLRAAGVTVAIDDFGTGFSSLSYLKELPVDTLKIDRSFVAGLASDGTDREIVAAICSLGRSLGLTIVGEGVETSAIAARLLEAGCAIHQGFLYHRPAPPDEVTATLTERRIDALASTAAS